MYTVGIVYLFIVRESCDIFRIPVYFGQFLICFLRVHMAQKNGMTPCLSSYAAFKLRYK